MRRSLFVAMAVALTPQVSHAGWRGAEWNMAPEQVAAVDSSAPLDKGRPGERLGKRRIGNVGSQTIGEVPVRAVYYYDKKGLGLVSLTPDKLSDCQAMARGILAERGEPFRISDQVILKLIIWHEKDSGNRLRLMLSDAGICTLYYERLEDYEAIDHRLKAEGR